VRGALAVVAILAQAAPAPAAPAPLEIGVASALEKLRPGDPIPRAAAVDLVAARGECESAQIAVRAPRGLASLSAEATALAGASRLRVALYRVETLWLERPSGPDGEAGEWPDPLVPERDPFFGERRGAFPVRVGRGRLQAIWVEVCVPEAAAPGRYTGSVRLADQGVRVADVPVRLRVWPFVLPRTGAFPAAFGLSTRAGARALGAERDPEVARALAAAALRNRVTPLDLSGDPPAGSCTATACELDWSRYDAELGPVLDGTLVPGVRGALAAVRIPAGAWSGPERDVLATLRAWRSHFEARGWSDRLRLYASDDPRLELREVARRGRLARAEGIRVVATTPPERWLASAVDEFAPDLASLAEGPTAARASWSFTSCLSHGCDELPGAGPLRAAMRARFSGWPGYEIDRPATAARAVPLLGFRRGLGGTLYYDMIRAWDRDPWTDVRASAGNGDGTLLYPGLPPALGGERPFPVESIRLKVIRDALEDVELFRAARAAGEGALADRLLEQLVPSARSFERRPGPWLAARRALGDAVARRALRAPR
jgi:Domain of unknown function (DUF4091)/Family of unknown function (DUF6067)